MEETNELSPYAKFHYKFLGYDFQNILTGQVYSKSIAYTLFPQYCDNMVNMPNDEIIHGFTNSKFKLLKREDK